MTTAAAKRHSPRKRVRAGDRRGFLAGVGRRASGTMKLARTGATMLLDRLPATLHATRVGAQDTTSALQTLPDSTLRWLAASSVGLGAGFYLRGAPRLVIAAAAAPALIMGAAIALRPIEAVPQEADQDHGPRSA